MLTFIFAVGTLIFSTHLSAQDKPLSFGFKGAQVYQIIAWMAI